MRYIEVSEDTYIKFDEDTLKSSVIVKSSLVREYNENISRLNDLPSPMTDEQLLAWAKLNYPQMNYEVERKSLEERQEEIEKDLLGIA